MLNKRYKYFVGTKKNPRLNAFSSKARAQQFAKNTGLILKKR